MDSKMIFRRFSYSPNVTQGWSAQLRRKPKMNPKRCAQLSTQGKRPARNSTAVMPTILRMAISGYLRVGHWCMTSTMAKAKRPKWAPAGPTSARQGTKIAEAKFPTMPDPKQIMEILADPQSFSKSRISQYWSATVRAKCSRLKEITDVLVACGLVELNYYYCSSSTLDNAYIHTTKNTFKRLLLGPGKWSPKD